MRRFLRSVRAKQSLLVGSWQAHEVGEYVASPHSQPSKGRSARVYRALLLFVVLTSPLFAGHVTNVEANHDLLEQVSAGNNGVLDAPGAAFAGSSEDGTHVFIQTDEALVAGDTDNNCNPDLEEDLPPRRCIDVYERAGGVMRLVSTGPSGGNGNYDATYAGTTYDGKYVFFETNEPLVPSDTDTSQDVYMRSAGTTTLVSVGPSGGNAAQPALFDAAVDARYLDFGGNHVDSAYVIYETAESLVTSDTDSYTDIYRVSVKPTGNSSLTPFLMSGGGNGPYDADYVGFAYNDDFAVYFETNEPISSADTDSGCGTAPGGPCADVYRNGSSGVTLMSRAATGSASGAFDAGFLDAGDSAQGLLFSTSEQLDARDADSSADIYFATRDGSTATTTMATPAGSAPTYLASAWDFDDEDPLIQYLTTDRLVAADTDSALDLYQGDPQDPTSATLLSTGPNSSNGPFDAEFVAKTNDGVIFESQDKLVSSDTDSSTDVYKRSGATTTLLSTGPTGGNGSFDANGVFASKSGGRVFFETAERLVGADTDTAVDLYERRGSTTSILSVGPGGGSGAYDVEAVGASFDGTHVLFQTDESITSSDSNGSSDLYDRSISLPSPCTSRYQSGDLQSLGDLKLLSPGGTLCLDSGGSYGPGTIERSDLTIRGTPGHTTLMQGPVSIVGDDVKLERLVISGTNTSGAATLTIRGRRIIVTHLRLQNSYQSGGCVAGGYSFLEWWRPSAQSAVITYNQLYDCGDDPLDAALDLGSAPAPTVTDNVVWENSGIGIKIGRSSGTFSRNVLSDNCAVPGSCPGNITFADQVADNVVSNNTFAYPRTGQNALGTSAAGANNRFEANCVWRSDGSAGVSLPQPPFVVSFTPANPAFVDRTTPVHAWRNYSVPTGNACDGKEPNGPVGP
jgi:hypothetical protein